MTTARRLSSLGFALVVLLPHASVVRAQASGQPAPPVVAAAPQAVAPADAASAVAAPPLEPQGFTYDPQGRRDPFVNLLQRGNDGKSAVGSRPAGLAGLETHEVTLKGTVASQGSYVGILLGVDSKTYIVKPGDRLHDGTIRAISQDSLVVTQQVSDPLSREKEREVRKALRQTGEGK